ncbi:MAG: ribonuclease D [Alphaproteobacteria bacterium]
MQIITTTNDLKNLCERLKGEPYVTLDTEFVREKTYWPELCLIQIAGQEDEAIIDPLADGIDLDPLFTLMADENVLKVLHAARQDVEIFVKIMGDVPRPMFDTQIAAMVCGFGDQVGYETLCRTLLNVGLDKSSRFTDWARRPLTDRQLDYAIGDVTYLRTIYEKLSKRLEKTGRDKWVAEEMAALHDKGVYITQPDEAWQRIKRKSHQPRFVAILQALAAWRETTAQNRNMPRNRVMKDDGLLEIAAHGPDNLKELDRMRSVPKGFANGKFGSEILDAVKQAKAIPENKLPNVKRPKSIPKGNGSLTELLKVLLKTVTEQHDVAPRLIASVAELEMIAASDKAEVAALSGWRRELFGQQALDLKHGKLGLIYNGDHVELVHLPGRDAN